MTSDKNTARFDRGLFLLLAGAVIIANALGLCVCHAPAYRLRVRRRIAGRHGHPHLALDEVGLDQSARRSSSELLGRVGGLTSLAITSRIVSSLAAMLSARRPQEV
jgi:hypothetical protein